MDIFHISSTQAVLLQDISAVPSPGFLWLDATHDEVTADVNAWRDTVERATGVHIYDLHLSDAVNLSHPSYFDATQDYALMVFRKLALAADKSDADQAKRRIPPALSKLDTKPVTFLLMDNALVTVHAENSRTIDAMRSRLLEARNKREGATYANRPPASAEELMLRLLNAMVDQYLALRQPLTAQIDRWQRALLNPRSLFNDWTALLDARIELRKLDQLSEGQHDAVQELRDYLIDSHSGGDGRAKDMLLVRANDVMEHIARVLNHARRLESTIESAVQIHFSAMAHRTSEIMRTLTVITALFMPLTLITGIFGMNFVDMPLIKGRDGFWIAMALMAAIVVVLLFVFRRKRYLDDGGLNGDQ
ncbi:magnesium transporter CorA family protein [Noviherbaspirillum sp. UKPF54]|uniref:magnesium transporter CorA family protein n=1 Tax=Noviherbaspirillum sp. UKPF54 TaxID=2601898 RepID=UPI0011B1036C|nr:magnesium transporter CorA family protein [Noviherbaspirillum sp. UKPF54]QDZ30174.1 magnesium transporter CorA family protein [Noviherbaspirillum sp. UKPF54]